MRHIHIHKNAGIAVAPTVVLNSITLITKNGCNYQAEVTSDGGSTITARGVSFYTAADCSGPYLDSTSAAGLGVYGGSMTILNSGVTYYARAWAENSVGRSVSGIISFTTTSAATIPGIGINGISNITGTSADVACEVLSKGGGTISVSGICWNTSGFPTTASSKTTNGITQVGTFTSVMAGLTGNARYYVKAYATNEAGTSYSAESNFLTTGRVLILQFNTNCPPTKAFSPSIVPISGSYEWDLGNGTTVVGNAVSHTYSDSSTKTVKLYCTSGTPSISDMLMYNQYVVGMMDISHSAFVSLVRVNIYNNLSMTGITLPTTITGAIERFNISFNGLIGDLNLAALVNFNSAASISLNNNPITLVSFGNTATGLLNYLDMRNCNLTGTASFTWLSKWADNSSLLLLDNPNLTSVHFGTTQSVGSLQSLDIRSCALNTINVGDWATSTRAANLVYIFQDNGMTAGEVNLLLWELNVNAIAGSTGQIFIGGTNAAPDSTSDNLNGLVYKASLISKGFQVTTN